MSTGQVKLAEAEPIPENGFPPSAEGKFRMFSRVIDWITSERMQLINITDRINEIEKSRFQLLPKPFAPDTLAQRIREVLDDKSVTKITPPPAPARAKGTTI